MRLSRRAELLTTGSIAGFSQTSRSRPSAGVVMCPRTKAAPGSWRKRYGDAGGRPRRDGRRLWLFPSRPGVQPVQRGTDMPAMVYRYRSVQKFICNAKELLMKTKRMSLILLLVLVLSLLPIGRAQAKKIVKVTMAGPGL